MKLTPIAAGLVAILSLTACGKGGGSAGVNASTESNQGLKMDEKESIDRSKDLTAGRSAKVSFDADFAPLLSRALTDAMPVTSIKAGEFFTVTYHGKYTRQHVLSGVDRALAQLGFEAPEGTISEGQKALAARERERVDAMVGANDARDALARAKLACLDATIAGNYVKARACYQEYLPHAYTLHVLQAARVPQKGHLLDERVLTYRGNERTFPTPGQLETLTYGLVNVAHFANDVEARLATTLTANTFRDDEGAKRVVEALLAIPAADLIKISKATAAPEGLTIRVANGQKGEELVITVVEFAATYTQNDKGVVETTNGAIRYGDGYINNAKVKVTMDKSVDAKISTKTSTGGSTTVDSGVSDKADVSVGSK